MTATIHRPKHVGKHRRPPRFAVMEALGFIDVPGSATRHWTAPPVTLHQEVDLRDPPSSAEPEPAPHPIVIDLDPFQDWHPTEVGSRLLEGRVRWGLLSLIVVLSAAVAIAGYWLYRQPQIAADEARSHVAAEAGSLLPMLDDLEQVSLRIAQPDFDASEVDSVLLDVDSQARELFEVSGSLAANDQPMRASLADAAGDAMDAARMVGEAISYKGAVVPILIAPALETDPELVTLDDAAARFSDWQARFDRVLGALPGALGAVTTELSALSGDLTGIQRAYLDTLRHDDGDGAATVIRELDHRLSEIEQTLIGALVEVEESTADRIAASRQVLTSIS